jgi:predicted DNA-binding protein (UPF0251 family)
MTPGRRATVAEKARKAALLHLDEGVEIVACCERYGVARSAVWRVIKEVRAECAAAKAQAAP